MGIQRLNHRCWRWRLWDGYGLSYGLHAGECALWRWLRFKRKVYLRVLHPPLFGMCAGAGPRASRLGVFFCSGLDLPGPGKRIIVRYNLTQCPDLQPPQMRIIVRFTPSRSRCPVPWFGFRGTIVRVRVWASLRASLPGHLTPTLLCLQPEGIRTIVRFF